MEKNKIYSKITFMVVAGLTSLGIQAAPPSSVPVNVVSPVFVGVSTDSTTTSVGRNGMNRVCSEAYGPGTHMCSTTEFFAETRPDLPLEEFFWIHPELRTTTYDGLNDKFVHMTATGRRITGDSFRAFATCSGYTTDSATVNEGWGTIVYNTEPSPGVTHMIVTRLPCGFNKPVVCCASR